MSGVPTGRSRELPPGAFHGERPDGTTSRSIAIVAVLVAVAAFVYASTLVVLAIFVSIVLAFLLNAPVRSLEKRGVPRGIGTMASVAVLAVIVGLLAWFVVPRVLEQAGALADAAPGYAQDLEAWSDRWLDRHPWIDERVDLAAADQLIPSSSTLASHAGRFSAGVLTVFVLTLVIVATSLYMVIRPQPLLAGLLKATPTRHRDALARALARAAAMLTGWMRANVIVGLVEAVLVVVVLGLLGIPGALVWAALAFFAEMVPKVGPYLMAAPPLLVALATDPMDALWVLLFYIVMNELMGDFVTPRVQGAAMRIHPAYLLIAVIVFGSLFGLLGALLATPLTVFVAAFWQEFYMHQRDDAGVDERVQRVLDREYAAAEPARQRAPER